MVNPLKELKTADFVTLSNAVIGLLSILYSIKKEFVIAAILLVLCVILDGLDGLIAKRLKQTTELGKQLDSLADIISFGGAPVALVYSLNNTTLAIISYIFFICCGILRLARYNVSNIKDYFQGMPITTNGILIPLFFFIKVPYSYYPLIYFILGILMISTFKVKRVFR